MYEYIKGSLAGSGENSVVVDVGGIGYLIEIPLSTSRRLPENGAGLKLFVHYHVREDQQKLFGFLSSVEREIFRRLLSINKVGPRVALSVLSKCSIKEIIDAARFSDTSSLKRVPGIGARTAERLVVDLKNKLSDLEGYEPAEGEDGGEELEGDRSESEAFDALISLGYSEAQVRDALRRVREASQGREAGIEELIRMALQVI